MARHHPYSLESALQILRCSESPTGGHTLARHVNISHEDLVRRVFHSPNGGIANYGAFRRFSVDDAARAAQSLLNSPNGQIALQQLDHQVEAVKRRHPGRPLTPEEAAVAFGRRTIRAVPPPGLRLRWVNVGSIVIEAPANEATMTIDAIPGGTILIVTCYPIFTSAPPGQIQVLQRFDVSQL